MTEDNPKTQIDAELQEAINLLDDSNDAHWNKDNTPKIPILQELLKRKQITKAEVQAVSNRIRSDLSTANKSFSSPDLPDGENPPSGSSSEANNQAQQPPTETPPAHEPPPPPPEQPPKTKQEKSVQYQMLINISHDNIDYAIGAVLDATQFDAELTQDWLTKGYIEVI